MTDASSVLAQLWSGLLDLVFPPRCVGCGREGGWLCPACLAAVRPVPPPTCAICYESTLGTDICSACRRNPLEIDGIRSVSLHKGALREAVHGLKYENQRVLAPAMAGLMRGAMHSHGLAADVLVPVPLHKDRQRERGFNQSALLARAMAQNGEPALPVDEESLVRVRATASQTTLNRVERRANMAGAFACRDGRLAGKRVLLIDDVCTTGATLEACAVACRAAGAASVWGLTLTR